jgi:hypothetical protein
VARIAQEFSSSSVDLADVSGLSFEVAANTNYTAEILVILSSAIGSGGARFAVTGPANPTALFFVCEGGMQAINQSRRAYNAEVNALSAFATNFGQEMLLADWAQDTLNVGGALMRFFLNLQNGSNAGTVQFQAAAEIVNNEMRIKLGSLLRVWQG